MEDIKTIKGVWATPNKFIEDNGNELQVFAQTYLLPDYKDKWPLECYANIYYNGKYNVLTEILSLEPNSSQQDPESP